MTAICCPPKEEIQKILFTPPQGACDSHAHVFGPFAQFPLSDDRSYTPGEFSAEDFRDHLRRIGISRGVLVTASVCGTNNGSVLSALEKYPEQFRGIVVCSSDVTDQELDHWHNLGVRGVRFNLLRKNGQAVYRNGVGLEVLESLAPRMAERAWHAQIWVHAPDLPELAPRLLKLNIPLVIDHMGRMDTVHGTHNPGFKELCSLVGEGLAWVKISGADRIRASITSYDDVRPFALELMKSNIERIVWGTDWPHINYFDPQAVPDDGDLTNLLLDWLPNAKDREQVLVHNPATLYGF